MTIISYSSDVQHLSTITTARILKKVKKQKKAGFSKTEKKSLKITVKVKSTTLPGRIDKTQ